MEAIAYRPICEASLSHKQPDCRHDGTYANCWIDNFENPIEAKSEEVAEQNVQTKSAKKEESIFDNPVVKQVGRTAAAIITRSLLGALGLGGRSSSKRR